MKHEYLNQLVNIFLTSILVDENMQNCTFRTTSLVILLLCILDAAVKIRITLEIIIHLEFLH